MTIKILLGAAITAMTAGGIAYATVSEDTSETRGAGLPRANAAAPDTSGPGLSVSGTPASAATKLASKAAWQQRLSKIHAAHAAGAVPISADGGHERDDGDCERDDSRAAMCMDEACLESLAREVLGLTEGCRDLMADAPPDLSLTAHVVGAPDVGTIVASVELGSDTDAPTDLAECLTEAMYTLDLGEAEANFEQDITVMLQSAAVVAGEPLDLEHLDEETRTKVEAAMAEMGELGDGEHAEFRILRLGAEIPESQDEDVDLLPPAK